MHTWFCVILPLPIIERQFTCFPGARVSAAARHDGSPRAARLAGADPGSGAAPTPGVLRALP